MASPTSADAQIDASTSLSYWSKTAPTISGMLGGYPQVSTIDLRSSYAFITKLLRLYPHPFSSTASLYPTSPEKAHATRSRSGTEETNGAETDEEGVEDGDKPANRKEGEKSLPFTRGLDCGAGIGRVTAGFLSRVCEVVDVVEPIAAFSAKIKDVKMAGSGKVGEVYTCGLECFAPKISSQPLAMGGPLYDLIWIQWCIGHLTDAQLTQFLGNCKTWLRPGGWLIVKENMSTTKAVVEGSVQSVDIFDEVDSSVTRCDGTFRRLFKEARWRVERTEVQRGFEGVAKGLLPVRIYALRPEKDAA